MKKNNFILIFITLTFILIGCPKTEPVVDYFYIYSVEMNIDNKSSTKKTISADYFIIYEADSMSKCQEIGNIEGIDIAPNSKDIYRFDVMEELVASPKLSHIFNIENMKFAGFDTNKTLVIENEPNETVKITAEKDNLGSVNWQNTPALISYSGENYEVTDNYSTIKLIYDVIIKDETDITSAEKSEYTNGVKISVSHEIELP